MNPRSPDLPWAPPDYAAACLTQVLPSAAAVLARQPPVLPMPSADRVVVLLVDGLGHELLGAHHEAAPFLSRMEHVLAEGIDAAFPSTTAASLTSLGTGLAPGSHGIVGASFWLPEIDNVLFPLGWRDRPSPQVVQPEPTVFEQVASIGIAATVVAPRDYASSGLTRSALRGARYVGADSPGEAVVALAAAAADPAPALVYGYFPTVDKSGHIHGAGSPQWRLDLQYTDLAVRQLADRLPPRTLLLVTGDHGMVNCPDSARICVDGHPFSDGLRRMAGEPRMRHLYAKPTADPHEIALRWRDALGSAAVVLTRDAALAAGLFGEVAPGIEERIGDVLALPVANVALVSEHFDSIVSGLRGQHGGLTDVERRVPLLAWMAG